MNTPSDHPPIPPQKIGVIVCNLGTPEATDYWSMRRYLNQFLSDRRVIDYSPFLWQPLLQTVILTTRPSKSGAAYRSIWNTEADESPLLTITKDQTNAIKTRLAKLYGDKIITDFAMRYGSPAIKTVIKQMKAQGADKILFFPLYPQYAGATTATANDEAFRALMTMPHAPAIRTVP
ncbi:MAG: ferrochelatase, partial [Proteobacteria bacterium]|nr:ferrochelatase [Pseudomonadota bacterium]